MCSGARYSDFLIDTRLADVDVLEYAVTRLIARAAELDPSLVALVRARYERAAARADERRHYLPPRRFSTHLCVFRRSMRS